MSEKIWWGCDTRSNMPTARGSQAAAVSQVEPQRAVYFTTSLLSETGRGHSDHWPASSDAQLLKGIWVETDSRGCNDWGKNQSWTTAALFNDLHSAKSVKRSILYDFTVSFTSLLFYSSCVTLPVDLWRDHILWWGTLAVGSILSCENFFFLWLKMSGSEL